MKSLLLALFLSLSPLPSFAASPTLDSKVSTFNQIFFGSTSPRFVYHPLFCSSNILNLYFIFDGLKFPLEGDRVVVIFEKDRSSFFASNARLSEKITKPEPFTLHVIYVSERQVFDFDFGQAPAVVNIETYLARQFPAEQTGITHKQLLARVYTPLNYLRAYQGPNGNPLILDPKNFSEKLVELKDLPAELSVVF